MKASKAKKDPVNNQDAVQARLEAYGRFARSSCLEVDWQSPTFDDSFLNAGERFMALFESGEENNLKKDVSAAEPNSVDGEVKTDSSGHKANLKKKAQKPEKDGTGLDLDISFLDKGKRDPMRKRTHANATIPANLEASPKAEGWKQARKQFMSSRADKILGISADNGRSKVKKTMKLSFLKEENQTLSIEEFDKVKREVQLFGKFDGKLEIRLEMNLHCNWNL